MPRLRVPNRPQRSYPNQGYFALIPNHLARKFPRSAVTRTYSEGAEILYVRPNHRPRPA
jgi:hypothetical protein